MRICSIFFLIGLAAGGADWLQFGGHLRNFQLPASVKIPRWPAGGPKQVWARDLGDGYSSMVISGQVIYTMYRKGTQDVVIALDAGSGKTVWETAIDAAHLPGMNVEAGPGPHSTPTIVDDRIFVTTVAGRLVALDRKAGKQLWSQELWKEHKGTSLERGYAASPLPYKGSIVVPVGGTGRALMAFRQSDGSKIWSSGDLDSSYASPIAIQAGGRDQVVTFMAKDVLGMDAASGEVLWTMPHKTMYDINAATPAWCQDASVLVVSSGYDGGARGFRIGKSAEELWHHNRFRVHHTNMACADGVVYGSSGDFGPAPFTAVEAKTGAVLWQSRAFSKASFLLGGNTVFVADDDGSVAMAGVSRKGLELRGEAQLLRANSWTVPVIDGNRFIVRDRHRIIALALE